MTNPFRVQSIQASMSNLQTAVFGGGCFWCIEAVFGRVAGVKSAESGFMGGHLEDPTYQQVCTGHTGHAEVVRVTFEPDEVSYRTLLEIFFTVHDPTTVNRQGNDIGPQYRSVIFYMTGEQRSEAEKMIRELNAAKVWLDPIVTALEPAAKFFKAEGYHQEYYANNPAQPYCRLVIEPKLRKFQHAFSEKLRA